MSLTVREGRVQTTVRCHFTPARTAKPTTREPRVSARTRTKGSPVRRWGRWGGAWRLPTQSNQSFPTTQPPHDRTNSEDTKARVQRAPGPDAASSLLTAATMRKQPSVRRGWTEKEDAGCGVC